MTQRFAFSTSKTLLAVAIFTSMTTSHAEEPAEQQNSTNVLPTISIQAQKKPHFLCRNKSKFSFKIRCTSI